MRQGAVLSDRLIIGRPCSSTISRMRSACRRFAFVDPFPALLGGAPDTQFVIHGYANTTAAPEPS
jgi:hypothetical protein